MCQAFWQPKRCLSLLLQGAAVRIGRPAIITIAGLYLYVGGECRDQSVLCVLLQQVVSGDACARFYRLDALSNITLLQPVGTIEMLPEAPRCFQSCTTMHTVFFDVLSKSVHCFFCQVAFDESGMHACMH